MYWSHHYWGMHVFWWIFWLIMMTALLTWAWPTQAKRRDSAVEELRRTYASGQITEEEYRHRLAVLDERPPDKRTHSAA